MVGAMLHPRCLVVLERCFSVHLAVSARGGVKSSEEGAVRLPQCPPTDMATPLNRLYKNQGRPHPRGGKTL